MKAMISALLMAILSSPAMALTLANEGSDASTEILFGVFKGDGTNCDQSYSFGKVVSVAPAETYTVPPESLPKDEKSLCVIFYPTKPSKQVRPGATITTDSQHIALCYITFIPDPHGKEGTFSGMNCK